MLLGFVMSERDIEENAEKISTIMDMGPIKNLKVVQRVTGCLSALSRFIARLGECSLPLYKLMKKFDHFSWTPVSYGPPWAHYRGGYQDRLLGGPLGLPGLRYTASEGVEHKEYTGVVLG
jgi:hypothetical protein